MPTAQEYLAKAYALIDAAELRGGAMTDGERREVEDLLAKARVDNIGRQLGAPGWSSSFGGAGFGGAGDVFCKSEGWRKIADPGTRPQSWSTGAIEIPPFDFQRRAYQAKAGTVLESGQGAGLIPVPQVLPGVVETLFEPLGVSDAFAQGQASSSSVRYIVEGTADNAATGVAEGALKPASDLALSTTDEAVKKLATVVTVSDELLEDVVNIQPYLISRLQLFVRIEEEKQLLRGGGTNDLVGMFGRSIGSATKAAGDDNATAIAKVIANTRGGSFLEPDTVILHPNQWLSTRLLRDGAGGTVGQFYGGGPFTGAYGNGGAADAGLFGELIWGKRVVLSTVVGPGTALIGSFLQAAKVMRRGGPTIEISNSHSDYFQMNLAMLRCESRLALCVFRPVAFTQLTGLD